MSPKILSVDDSKTVRRLLARLFEPFNCSLFEAANGEEGLAVAAREKPDLILLDYNMPVMDGISATKAIRESDPNAVIVMCTAMGQKNMVIEAIQAGAKDFIVKPFEPERVLECVKKLLAA